MDTRTRTDYKESNVTSENIRQKIVERRDNSRPEWIRGIKEQIINAYSNSISTCTESKSAINIRNWVILYIILYILLGL